MGSKKWVKTLKNYHAPKFEFSTTPRSSISAKMRPYGYGAKSQWGPPRVDLRPKCDLTVMAPNHCADFLRSILGPMGSHWVHKIGQNRKKLPCPKIRIFDYPTVIDFGQNSTLLLWRQITMGIPRVHLGANGVPLGPKNGSKP